MTKIKKIVAAAVAAVGMGALGITALAEATWGDFSFRLQGSHWDNYVAVSNGVEKGEDWLTDARVTVDDGNVSPNNTAEIAVVAMDSWPEAYLLTDWKTVNAKKTYPLEYVNRSNTSFVKDHIVYLSARTGAEDVYFSGTWTP